MHETVLTVAALPCCSALLVPALKQVGSFLTSRHHSTVRHYYKLLVHELPQSMYIVRPYLWVLTPFPVQVYTGLCGLAALFTSRPPALSPEQVQSCPVVTTVLYQSQEAGVLGCLDHTDPAIQTRAALLLVSLAQPNSQVLQSPQLGVKQVVLQVRTAERVLGLAGRLGPGDCSRLVGAVAGLADTWPEQCNTAWRAATLLR